MFRFRYPVAVAKTRASSNERSASRGPRVRRRGPARATRQRLLDAGRAAFAAKGLAGVNLRNDILEPAGVSVGSFYHQFEDKTELLLAILDEHAQLFRARLSEVHRPGPGRSIRDIAERSFGLVFDLAEADESIWRIQMKERDSRDPRVRAFLRVNRERWIESLAGDYARIADSAGGAADRFDADLAARLVVGLCWAAMAEYTETPPAERAASRERLLGGLVDFTMGGIGDIGRGKAAR